jgi:chemotaxis protein CheD
MVSIVTDQIMLGRIPVDKLGFSHVISVSLGEIKVSGDPEHELVAFGLGSCLGVAMYDPKTHIGGMLHAVLPVNIEGSLDKPGKFVDSGIRELLFQMQQAGAVKERLNVRLVGGARMLQDEAYLRMPNIGQRNIMVGHKVLFDLGLEICLEDVGESTSRTARLFIRDGRLTVRKMGRIEIEM